MFILCSFYGAAQAVSRVNRDNTTPVVAVIPDVPSGAAWRERKRPLFEKSGAKTFFTLGHGRCRRHYPWPQHKKFFCFFLFTKRSLPFRRTVRCQIDARA
jgi:hypothetical protein